MRRILRRVHAVCALGVCVAWAGTGLAQNDTKQRCLSAYEDAQVLTREGDLIQAREKAEFCASSECPDAMHGDCLRWLGEVEDSIPTVVFQVQTPSGSTSGPATVSIDGADSVPVDGRAISVNPGQHTVTFSARGERTTSKVLVFSEGEKLRREVVLLDPIPGRRAVRPATRSDSSVKDGETGESSLTLPIVLASSVAVVGGAGFAYLGLTARSEDRKLDECTPNCTQGRVDSVKGDYRMANISLGLGAAGLVTAVVLAVLEYSSDTTPSSARIWLAPPPVAGGVSFAGSF